MEKQKKKALTSAISQIDRRFGKGSIMRMGDAAERMEVSAVPTGAIALDLALGIGGIPRGRVTEIFGPEASGKTTLALHIIAEAQKMGGVVSYIDAEHALDPKYMQAVGVNLDELLISQPDTGEQALEICEALVRSGAVDVVVIDSVAALVPRAELEGDMGDSLPGLQARLMSQALRKLSGAISKSKTAVVFVNQIRMKIGVMFGNPETTSGGRALKFYSSVRLDIRRVASIKDSGEVIGNRVRVKVVKNKVAPPFRKAEFDIIYNEGISREGSLIDVALDEGVMSKAGSHYYFGEDRIAQGRENSRQYLLENPDVADEIERLIRESIELLPPTATAGAGGEEDEELVEEEEDLEEVEEEEDLEEDE